MADDTHYETLGVPSSASDSEIKSAYRALAKTVHPDRTDGRTAALFRRVENAYEILGDASARAAYDRELAAGRGWQESIDVSFRREAPATDPTGWRWVPDDGQPLAREPDPYPHDGYLETIAGLRAHQAVLLVSFVLIAWWTGVSLRVVASGWPGFTGWIFTLTVLAGLTAATLWRFAMQPCSLLEIAVLGAFGLTVVARPSGWFWIALMGTVIITGWWGTLVALPQQLDPSSVAFGPWWSSQADARTDALRYGLHVHPARLCDPLERGHPDRQRGAQDHLSTAPTGTGRMRHARPDLGATARMASNLL